MAEGPTRPFLIGGERMKHEAPKLRRGRAKTPRFTYAQVKERLLPLVVSLREEAGRAPNLRTAEFVFRATLWPEYLAASYFPEVVIENAGLDLVGSRPAHRERVTPKRTDPSALTKTLFLAGTDVDIERLQQMLSGDPPPDDVGDALWDDIRAIADIDVARPDDVFRPPLDLPHEKAGDPGIWECVLHRTADSDAAMQLFAKRVAELDGRTDLTKGLEVGGLIYLSASVDQRGARLLAQLNPMRAVRPLPKIRPITGVIRSVGIADIAAPSNPTPITEHRVAIFDGGADRTCSVASAAMKVFDLTSAAPDSGGVEHGSVVTNAALFGYATSTDSLRRPEFGVDHYRIWPPPPSEATDPDLYWVLRQIREVILRERHRVAVICVAPDQEVDDGTPHPWTAILDDVAHATGTLFVVAAGNRGDLPAETGLNRVQVPADMANALGVGAATSRAVDSRRWDRAYYSSHGPGRPGGIMQPLVLQFGGTPEAPFLGISKNGARVLTMGTSFAAPLVAHGLGSALAAVGAGLATSSFLRALAVHCCDRSRPHRPVFHSFGRTRERFDGVWNCEPNEVTLLYADELERHTPIALPLPVPDGLPDDTVLQIKCTAAFQTPVDASDPVDYSLSTIEWSFRPHIEMFTFRLGEGAEAEERTVDVADEEQVELLLNEGWVPSGAPITGPLNEFPRSEEERRRTDGKWETVFKAWAQPTVANLRSPRLEFRYLAREGGGLRRGAGVPRLPFALLVTVTAPPDVPLYERVRQQFQLLAPIQLDARVSV